MYREYNLIRVNEINKNMTAYLPECIDAYCRLFILKPPSFLKYINYDETSHFYQKLCNYNALMLLFSDNIISSHQVYKLLMDYTNKIMKEMRGLYKERRDILAIKNGNDRQRDQFIVRGFGRKYEKLRVIKRNIGITE